MLATLGRAWDRLSEFTDVDAVEDSYGWQPQRTVRAFWIWQAGTTAWLDDNSATPSPPTELRLRTPGTVAVHGATSPGYIHKDMITQRHDVLAALGVAGEPSTGDLDNRLRLLRDVPLESSSVAPDTAVIYQGLADRLAGHTHVPGDLTLASLRQEFAMGPGLVRTNLGWLPPTDVLVGEPIFRDLRAFVPLVPGTDRLWSVLHIRQPSINDCIAVIRELAREAFLDVPAQTVVLETLRLLEELVMRGSLTAPVRRRLAKLPVWTSQGWKTVRPVYAIDDQPLAHGLANEVPVWQPGGESRPIFVGSSLTLG